MVRSTSPDVIKAGLLVYGILAPVIFVAPFIEKVYLVFGIPTLPIFIGADLIEQIVAPDVATTRGIGILDSILALVIATVQFGLVISIQLIRSRTVSTTPVWTWSSPLGGYLSITGVAMLLSSYVPHSLTEIARELCHNVALGRECVIWFEIGDPVNYGMPALHYRSTAVTFAVAGVLLFVGDLLLSPRYGDATK